MQLSVLLVVIYRSLVSTHGEYKFPVTVHIMHMSSIQVLIMLYVMHVSSVNDICGSRIYLSRHTYLYIKFNNQF